MVNSEIMAEPLERIDISDGLYIEYDTGDTWFAICDEDWTSYDQAGAVMMNVILLDRLIEKLTLLRGNNELVAIAHG